MGKKKKVEEVDVVESLPQSTEEVEVVNVIEDNPFSKKVKAEIEGVEHNKNNELLCDSDLVSNVML